MIPVNRAQVHEMAHVELAREGVDDIAIQFDGHSYTVWRKQAYRDEVHGLSCSLAGPLADMMTTGVINRHFVKPDADGLLESVLTFLRATQNGSTYDDAGKVLRYSCDEIREALPRAFNAADTAFTNVLNCHSRHAAVFEVLDGIQPNQCIVINQEGLASLRGERGRLRLPIVKFGTWYNAGISPEIDDARNHELYLECCRITQEMFRLGQLNERGLPNAAGMQRLELNERG